ncbi:hypothetical protein [Rubritalea tangerina]
MAKSSQTSSTNTLESKEWRGFYSISPPLISIPFAQIITRKFNA